MSRCHSPHPERSVIRCDRPVDNHEQHSGFDPTDLDSDYLDWPNLSYVRPVQTADPEVDRKIKDIAQRARAARR